MKVETLIVGPLQVCCYIVYDEVTKEALVIDPGDEDLRILHKLEHLGLVPKFILGTHAHPDHILGAELLRKNLQIPFLLHEKDAEFFQMRENFQTFRLWGFPENPKPDGHLKEGDVLMIGNNHLRVIHTPGHSPGSICFYAERDGLLFTGDTLFVEGIGRADLPGGDFRVLLRSIRERLFTLPEETVIYPGHDYGPSPTSTIKHERLFNPFLQDD
ncbi:MAG: MBL fold metallo-hydrolase [Caldimicrobium sp.]|nr:MBL fold metallo-hydrolase [Caldimicrobium sp.]MCX7612668.1 MBL fold metallo-hydrolase [Caldimicrobium sp.]MDW8182179.1 MBL fold metallo-hydrolase [Caldimicrobium sp.]